MPVLKILNDYNNIDAPEKLVDYVVRKAIFSDGFAVDLNHAAEQIHAVKGFWCETGGWCTLFWRLMVMRTFH